MAVLIDFLNRRTRQNIVELMAENDLPCFQDALIIVGNALDYLGQHGFHLHVAQPVFHPAVHFLIISLGGIGSAVKFQV